MAREWIKVIVDRPIGYIDAYQNRYPINYGFVPGVIGGDGEEQDAYILSETANEPLETFEGVLIAIIQRLDDIEDKWVISTPEEQYSIEQIRTKVAFIEQYFDSHVILVESN